MAVTAVELLWQVKSTPSHAQPTVLTAIARELVRESELAQAAVRVERAACKLLGITDAVMAWIDWPNRIAWTATGRLPAQTEELVLQVAGSGQREVVGGGMVIEPIGRAPARAALVLRRPGQRFASDECTAITKLAQAIAPTIDRLIGRP